MAAPFDRLDRRHAAKRLDPPGAHRQQLYGYKSTNGTNWTLVYSGQHHDGNEYLRWPRGRFRQFQHAEHRHVYQCDSGPVSAALENVSIYENKIALGLMVSLYWCWPCATSAVAPLLVPKDEPSDSADHASRTYPAPRSTLLAPGNPAGQALAAILLAAVEGETDPDRRSEALEARRRSVSDADLPAILDSLARDASPRGRRVVPAPRPPLGRNRRAGRGRMGRATS